MLFGGVTALLLAGIPAAAASAQQLRAAAPFLVFDGVTVVDVEQGRLVPGQRVVIAGNRIRAVGRRGTVKLPKRAQVVDARGKYLIPGLWDMHTHLQSVRHFNEGQRADSINEAEQRYDTTFVPYGSFLLNGVTGVRDAHSDLPLEARVQWRREILAGRRVGPPRQLLTGSAPEIHEGESDKFTESEIRALKARGANFIKVYPFTPALSVRIRRVGLPFGGHLDDGPDLRSPTASEDPPSRWPYNTPLLEASDSGISIVDHIMATTGRWPVTGLDTLCWLERKHASVARCRPVAEHLRRHNTWLVPTLHVYLGYVVQGYTRSPAGKVVTLNGPAARLLMEHSQQRLRQLWAGSLPLYSNWLRDSTASGSPQPPSQPPSQDSTVEPVGIMHVAQQAGLPLLAGTDAVLRPVDMGGFSLHRELALYVTEGLSPLEALRSATLNPAKMLRATDSLGTVAPGKLADLVLLDADPLTDITNTTTIRAVVANGHYFDRVVLDSLWTKIRARAKEPWEPGWVARQPATP